MRLRGRVPPACSGKDSRLTDPRPLTIAPVASRRVPLSCSGATRLPGLAPFPACGSESDRLGEPVLLLLVVTPSSSEIPAPIHRGDRYQLRGRSSGRDGGHPEGPRHRTWAATGRQGAARRHNDKPEVVRRFVEEAQIGGQLQHPGIVPVYELGTFADGRPFFAMKLVKGGPWRHSWRTRSVPVARTCRGSWRSSSRSARRWPMPTPGA